MEVGSVPSDPEVGDYLWPTTLSTVLFRHRSGRTACFLAVVDDEIDPVEDHLPVEDHRDRVDVEHQKPPSPPGRVRSIESATTTVITMRTTLSAIAGRR